jgi:hypothetical protein
MPLELIVEASGRIGFAPYTDCEPVVADKNLYLAETLDRLAALRDDRPAAVPIAEGVRPLDLALAARRSAGQNHPISMTWPAVSGRLGERL